MSNNSFNTSFGSIELKVPPALMHQTAGNISKKLSQLTNKFSLLEEKVARTKPHWEGAAAEKTRNLFVDEKNNFDIILNNINTYVQELYIITKNYEATEDAIEAASNELPSNILE